MKTISTLFFAAAAVAAVPLFAACGGSDIGAGKFAEYRLASVATPKTSGNCQVNAAHTTNFQSGSTILIYGTPGASADELFLDTGGKEGVLAGAKQDDGSFQFKGTATDVTAMGGTTFSQQTTLTISFTADGKSITGDTVADVKASCSGNCNGFTPTECTSTFNFTGVEVPDPDAPSP